VCLLLGLALAARVAFVLATPGYVPRGDDHDYLRLAAAIARSGVYPVFHVWVTRTGCPKLTGLPSVPCLGRPGARGAHLLARPTAYRPPAYPYALAVSTLVATWLGSAALAFARAFQVLIGLLNVALVGLVAGLIWGRRVGIVALGLAAVYLPFVLVSGTLISEPLYVGLMLGAIYAVLRWRRDGRLVWLPAAGVLAGLCALTRSNGMIVLVAIAVLAASGGRPGMMRRILQAVLVLSCGVLVIAPWTVRNAVVLHHLVPISTETGGTLVGTYNATSRADHAEPATWLGLSHLAGYGTLYREQSAHPETAIDTALRRDAIAFATEHPGYIASVVWHNTIRLFDLEGFARVRFGAGTIGLPGGPAVAAAIMFYVIGLLALVGALSARARRAPLGLWLLVVLQFASTVLVISETPRFRTPLDPFILLLAALVVERVATRWAGTWPRPMART
jgi:4-amino-4-deoxy-L-arabinose transferase-like glycosyltransferase